MPGILLAIAFWGSLFLVVRMLAKGRGKSAVLSISTFSLSLLAMHYAPKVGISRFSAMYISLAIAVCVSAFILKLNRRSTAFMIIILLGGFFLIAPILGGDPLLVTIAPLFVCFATMLFGSRYIESQEGA